VLHVFVETNWVVDCTAPAHNKMLAAVDLLRRAKEGELQLHLPAICLAEARHPLSTKFQPRPAADRVRQFVTWAVSMQQLAPEQAETVRRFASNYPSLSHMTKLCSLLCSFEQMSCLKPVNENSFSANSTPISNLGTRMVIPSRKLTELYDRANVWVYGDFLMQKPEMQPIWHYRS